MTVTVCGTFRSFVARWWLPSVDSPGSEYSSRVERAWNRAEVREDEISMNQEDGPSDETPYFLLFFKS